MRIALASLDQAWLDRGANLARCRALALEAAGHGAALIIFPEMTLTGYSLDVAAVAEPAADSASLRGMAALAQEAGLAILFGASLVHPGQARPLNSLCLADAGGAAILYEKIHPFSFAGEDQALGAGARLGSASVGAFTLGCTVCYDLRFPEIYSLMARSCNGVVNIANWPARRIAHWHALLVARAIENQYFVFGVNRTGTDGNGLHYVKSSVVVTPDGALLEPVVAGAELDIYEVDPEQVARYRAAFPTVADKRFDLYRAFY
jgi:omega-amidase